MRGQRNHWTAITHFSGSHISIFSSEPNRTLFWNREGMSFFKPCTAFCSLQFKTNSWYKVIQRWKQKSWLSTKESCSNPYPVSFLWMQPLMNQYGSKPLGRLYCWCNIISQRLCSACQQPANTSPSSHEGHVFYSRTSSVSSVLKAY